MRRSKQNITKLVIQKNYFKYLCGKFCWYDRAKCLLYSKNIWNFTILFSKILSSVAHTYTQLAGLTCICVMRVFQVWLCIYHSYADIFFLKKQQKNNGHWLYFQIYWVTKRSQTPTVLKNKKTGFIQFSDFCSGKLHKNLQVK